MGSSLRLVCKLFLLMLWLLPAPPALAQPSDLAPRRIPEKPLQTGVGPDRDASRVIVKFSESTR